MADAGMFRLLVPQSVGGGEIDYPTFVKIVRAFSEADASVAWCVCQNNIFATDASRMPLETAKEIWGAPRGIVTNGPPSQDTIAVPTPGGYRLTGHWDFSSGSSHSTWLAARSPVEGLNGEPRMFLVTKSDVTMIDRWQVNGLRGTASFSFEASDVFVSESHTYLESDSPREKGAIYTIPKIPLFTIGFGTISLALARACLDDATEVARQKRSEWWLLRWLIVRRCINRLAKQRRNSGRQTQQRENPVGLDERERGGRLGSAYRGEDGVDICYQAGC
jgi:alkylation response protein AidB-like acyl-CoA dehydrogenase